MPTQTLTPHQAQWQDLVEDPSLQDLPYKIETNEHGQLVLTPHTNRHSRLQEALQNLLREHAPDGRHPPEFALATPDGVKAPDVVWMSPEREREMNETADPSTRAPELCIEIMCAANTEEEMKEKRRLYRNIGAEEVWIVDEDGHIRFFGEEERGSSQIVPSCPAEVSFE
jgi:Uma2 family endonuclease